MALAGWRLLHNLGVSLAYREGRCGYDASGSGPLLAAVGVPSGNACFLRGRRTRHSLSCSLGSERGLSGAVVMAIKSDSQSEVSSPA